MHLLIIEDEKKTAAYLHRGLRENGFSVDMAANGIDGLHQALEGGHDLLVLDVMLPRLDGWSVLREFRAVDPTTPVLLLTAHDGVDYRVRGLDGGADDYLVKPFAFSELLARIRVALRRAQPQSKPVLSMADLVLDVLTRRATRQGARIDLTALSAGRGRMSHR